MRYKFQKNALSKVLLFASIVGFVASCVTSAFAADSSPLVFSFSVNPVSVPSHVTSSVENQENQERFFSDTGTMVNTSVESSGLKGGLSYFSGKGSKSSALDNFATLYSFKGWNQSDNILVFPNEVQGNTSRAYLDQNISEDNLQAISLYGGYDLTPSLKIKGAFLISKTRNTNDITLQSNLTNSSYSWWLDFGGDYKLTDKMTYSVNFGYSDSDDALIDSGSKNLVEGSVYLFNNQLNMSF